MNFLLKHVSEGKIEGAGRRGRGRKHLVNDRMEGIRYWKLKAESLDHILWRSRFGWGYVACCKTGYAIHKLCMAVMGKLRPAGQMRPA